MLNVTNKIDTGGEHSPARDIAIVDRERDHRTCSEEGMAADLNRAKRNTSRSGRSLARLPHTSEAGGRRARVPA